MLIEAMHKCSYFVMLWMLVSLLIWDIVAASLPGKNFLGMGTLPERDWIGA